MKKIVHNRLDTLLHRVETILTLAEDFSKHAFLLPEILIKSIQDTYRFINKGISHLNCIEILSKLPLECSQEELLLLQQIEHALRKSNDYNTLCSNYSKETLISITKKLYKYLIVLTG
ncbi:MAG: hypothetical protein ACRCWI_08230 [Brevinema sp.]